MKECPRQYAYICISKDVLLCMSMLRSLYVSIYAHIFVCKDTCLQMHICDSQKCSYVYDSISVSKDTTLYMPIYMSCQRYMYQFLIFGSQKTHISVCPYQQLRKCYSIYVNITVYIDAPIYIPTFVGLICPLPMTISKSIEGLY